MADDQSEAAKKTRQEYEEKSKGKPTPTQEENDRAAMGEHVIEKEPDGSAEQDPSAAPKTRQSEAKPSGGGYETRVAKPAQPAQRSAPRSE